MNCTPALQPTWRGFWGNNPQLTRAFDGFENLVHDGTGVLRGRSVRDSGSRRCVCRRVASW